MKESQRENIEYQKARIQEVMEYKVDDLLARYNHGTEKEQEKWWRYTQQLVRECINAVSKVHTVILDPDPNHYNINEFLEIYINTIDDELSKKYEEVVNSMEGL